MYVIYTNAQFPNETDPEAHDCTYNNLWFNLIFFFYLDIQLESIGMTTIRM